MHRASLQLGAKLRRNNTTLSELAFKPKCVRASVSMSQVHSIRSVFLGADAVCFDVDSTIIPHEGIDELASHLGVGDEVAQLTLTAMEGGMDYETSLRDRLNLMKPHKADVVECGKNTSTLTPGAKELISALYAAGKKVFLVSGGFKDLIYPVAEKINVPMENIFANVILYNPDGSYNGYDNTQPTCRAGGKAVALRQIMDMHNVENVVMVGDGATDIEAKPPAKAVIGCGVVVSREAVKEKADWFITDFKQLTELLTRK